MLTVSMIFKTSRVAVFVTREHLDIRLHDREVRVAQPHEPSAARPARAADRDETTCMCSILVAVRSSISTRVLAPMLEEHLQLRGDVPEPRGHPERDPVAHPSSASAAFGCPATSRV
jgi:hypothetical protein